MLISRAWLGIIFRNITCQLHKAFFTILRLLRHCRIFSSRNGKSLREHRRPAPTDRPYSKSKLPASENETSTLAAFPQSEGFQLEADTQLPVPSPVEERSNGVVFYTQHTQNLASSLPEFTEPNIPVNMSSRPAGPELYPNIALTPIIPGGIKRYDRKIFAKDEYKAFKIEKGISSYSKDCPTQWQPFTHPEGALFFYHANKKVFTDADVRDPNIATEVGRAIEKAYYQVSDVLEKTSFATASVELALELKENGEWGYYFVDCTTRVIFWYEDYISEDLIGDVRGVQDISHVKYAIESQYWGHIELFPNNRTLLGKDLVKLKGMVIHALAENITSDTCLAPFGSDEIGNMLTLMDPLSSSVDKEHEHSVCVVDRFMRLFCSSKFVNFCGQTSARLDADQPLYGDPGTRSKPKIYRLMNIILFGSPDAHSKSIHRIWVDETIVQPRWRFFIDRLNSEWNGYTIFSTVMLAVNISFLALPNVQNQTGAVSVSYLSTLCAMGSLMVSLTLAGQVNDARRNNAEGVASFVLQMTESMLGLESLAIMLSVPFALLIWCMIFFGVALSVLIFHTPSTAIISTASPIFIAVLILIIWPVIASYGIHPTALRAQLLDRLVHGESPEFDTPDVVEDPMLDGTIV